MEQDIKKLAAFIVPYSFLCSVLSVYVYWSFIDINAFDFIALQDILVHAAPFLASALVPLFPVVLLESLFPTHKRLATSEAVEDVVLKSYICLAAAAYVVVFILATTKYGRLYPYGYSVIFCVLIAPAIKLGGAELVRRSFQNLWAACAATLIFLCFPVLVIGMVADKATGIFDRADYTYVRASNLADLGKYHPAQELIYYGKLGNYLFFQEGSSVTAIPITAFKQLEFKRYQGER